MKTYLLTLVYSLIFFNVQAQYKDSMLNVKPVEAANIVAHSRLFVLWNSLVFAGDDALTGLEWRKFDGTNAPVTGEINPGNSDGLHSGHNTNYISHVVIKDVLYYTGAVPTMGHEICKWDGVSTPSIAVDHIPGTGSGNSAFLTAIDDTLYFVGDSISTMPYKLHHNVYEYDVITKKKQLIYRELGSKTKQLIVYNKKLYFCTETHLKEYDPAQGTIKDISSTPTNFYSPLHYGNLLYFLDAAGTNLYTFDGTSVKAVSTGYTIITSSPRLDGQTHGMMEHQGKIYFWAYAGTAVNNVGLYTYTPGTGQIQKTNAPLVPGGSLPFLFRGSYNGSIYFSTNRWLMRYDGNVMDTIGPDYSSPGNLAIYKGNAYLTANLSNSGSSSNLATLNSNAALYIQAPALPAEISIYPNPASTDINISINLQQAKCIAASLTDLSGRQVYDKKHVLYSAGVSKITLPINNLSKGYYIVTLKDNEGTLLWSGKVLKE